jgi:ABC transport system ATP-binding/permease protein
MSILFNCQALSKSFGTRLLFRDLSFSIFSGDRIGLIGPNGSGKSTLLKILAGLELPNEGICAARRGLSVGYVPQSCEFPDRAPKTILLTSLKKASDKPDYEKEHLVQTWLSKLGFTGDEPSASRLSGGWKKRLRLAQELIEAPELLLLDEPTNHLDLEGILWLEKFLEREAPSYILVSHDRYFLQNVVARVIEIDPVYPNGLFSIDGSYENFLEKKEEFLKGQLEQERSVASKARHELHWLRQSPKARTSKSKARVGQAHEILEELSALKTRNRQKKAEIDFSATSRETRKLLVAKNLSKEIDGHLLFHHLDFTLSPGTRIGLMGPNGSGKTTLLRLIAGEIHPDQGTIKKADGLKIVYFDQHRMQLPHDISLRQALAPNGEFVSFRGQMIHINGWCKRFLFSPEILDLPLERLSGGERARICIAHLMLQPADLLLLDEPTNDLDIPTLETLEESLVDFPGAVVLITHDRCMLDRICTLLLALGNPEKNELFADYSQWEASLKPSREPHKVKEKKPEKKSPRGKLSYLEKKEYEKIEEKISKHEEEIQQLHRALEDPARAQSPEQLQEICSEIALVENHIERLYLRWEELEKKLQEEKG